MNSQFTNPWIIRAIGFLCICITLLSCTPTKEEITLTPADQWSAEGNYRNFQIQGQALTEKDAEAALLFHTDGEHAGPYGDFLAAAAFCKLIYGAVSEEICGMGHDFLGGLPLDFSSPTVLEDDRVKTTLDEEKCRRIFNIIAD